MSITLKTQPKRQHPAVALHLQKGSYTLETLEKEFHIYATRHKTHPNLVSLKYDQINADFSVQLVRECRGLILDEDDNWNVVARGFDKFFNVGEHLCPIADNDAKSKVVAYEKKDGSLIMLYYYAGMWRAATTGTPDASGQVGDHGLTFEDLFWKTFLEHDYTVPPEAGHNLTYLFELMTPLNRVVVRHTKNKLSLLAVRNNLSGMLMRADQLAPNYSNYKGVKQLFGSGATVVQLKETFKTADPLRLEGYVIYGPFGSMAKLKHPGYVALHHMVSSTSSKSMLDIIRQGEVAEVLTAFPEYKPQFDALQSKYDALVRKITDAYAEHQHHKTQKEFALAVKELPFSAALFSLRKAKVANVEQFLVELPIDKLMTWIDQGDTNATV